MSTFRINRSPLYDNPRLGFVNEQLVPIDRHLENIEHFINECFPAKGNYVAPVQSGRVIALRATDEDRMASAFKSAIYLGKFDDMANTDRFLKGMVAAGHSYEPIRSENMMFLFLGVGKPVYDHLITHGVGRTRIAAGQRANKPWGYEVPTGCTDIETFMKIGLQRVEEVIEIVAGEDDEIAKQRMQDGRSLLPVGYIMPPFLLEFSEEALVNVFRRRIFENGAQGATKEIVSDMWDCCMRIDGQKWHTFFEHHGPHTIAWEKAMRTLRDKCSSLVGLMEKAGVDVTDESIIKQVNMPLYDLLMQTVGVMPKSMWDKE